MNATATRVDRLSQWAGECAVLILAILISLPPETYWNVRLVGRYRLFDESGLNGLTAELSDGRICGRDFVFNYGPLYQVIHGLGLIVPPGNVATLLRYHNLPQVVLVTLSLWGLLFCTGASYALRSVSFLSWVALVAVESEFEVICIKPMGGLIGVALCGRGLAAAAAEHASAFKQLAAILLWASCAVLLMWYAFDLGPMALLALLIVTALACLASIRAGKEASRLRNWAVALSLASAAGLAVFVLAATLSPAWGRYLPDTWNLAMGYSVALAEACSSQNMLILLAMGLACLVTLIWLSVRQRRQWLRGESTDPAIFVLIAALAFSLVWLRYGFLRTTTLRRSLCPSMFVFGCLLPCFLLTVFKSTDRSATSDADVPTNLQKHVPRYVALGLWILFVGLVPLMLTRSVREVLLENWKYRLAAPSFAQLAAPTVRITDETLRQATEVAAGLESRELFVWPYAVMINVLAGKVNPSYTVQSADAHTEHLQRRTIAELAAIPDLPILIYKESAYLRQVHYLTRNSLIFRYMLDHFELAATPRRGFVLLKPAKGTVPRFRSEPVGLTRQPTSFDPLQDGSLTVTLESDVVHASDLLALSLKASNTPLWSIRKPGRLLLDLELSDGTQSEQALLLPPDGESHPILVSASIMQDPAFLSVFCPRNQWQSTEHVVRMRLRWEPLDLLSIAPEEISIEGVSVLRRVDAEIIESPRQKQFISQSLLDRLYEGLEP